MRRLRLLLAIAGAPALLVPATTHAAPATAPRPALADTMTSSFEVSGVQVILRRNTANDVVAANLYLLGGTQLVAPEQQGIEPFLLWVSERGTRSYPRDVLRQRMNELGSTIVVEPRADWTMFGFRGVRSAFDSTWMVLADRLMHPQLDEESVAFIRAQVLSGIRQRGDSPDNLVHHLADSVTFVGHPYALSPTGTESSIARLSLADLQRWRETQLVTSRMLLVVVGNVDQARIEGLVQRTIGRLPRGEYRWRPPASIEGRPGGAHLVHRTLPTNYMLGYYAGPRSSDPDYQALRIASAVLSGRLFAEIRSRRNLTYAVEAPFVERAVGTGGLYVTTVYPDSVVDLMRREVFNLQTGLVDADNLQVLIQQFITQYFLSNETNAAQADFLARAQLYQGDWRAANRFVDELRRVTPDDIQRVARQYMKNVRWAYVGDTTRVTRQRLERF